MCLGCLWVLLTGFSLSSEFDLRLVCFGIVDSFGWLILCLLDGLMLAMVCFFGVLWMFLIVILLFCWLLVCFVVCFVLLGLWGGY